MSISDYLWDGTKPTNGTTPGFGRNIDLAEPDVLRAGDSITWTAAWSAYPSGQGWALTYVINSPTARFVVAPADVSPDPDLTSFEIAIPSVETKLWTAGTYQWIAVLSNGTQRLTAGLGQVVILANLLDATGPVDTRSQAEINLSTVEASLAARAAGGIDSYMISGRETKYMPIAELMRLRSLYLAQVRQERRDRGELPPSSTVVVEFGSPWR